MVPECSAAPELAGTDRARLEAYVYTDPMQLHTARLCLDCQEVHEAGACPICGSESFAYIMRWIPAPERRLTARPERPPNDVETYRQLLAADAASPKTHQWLKRGAVVAAAVTVAGWLFRPPSKKAPPARGASNATPREPERQS
jgi:hypothetical protein